VYDEALISAGGVATGNIGVVGTADSGEVGKVNILGGFANARDIFGAEPTEGKTLMKALNHIYSNGGQNVYAVRVADTGTADDYAAGLEALESPIVNIVLLAGQDTSMAAQLGAHLSKTEGIDRERIGLISAPAGISPADFTNDIDNDRIVVVAPEASEGPQGGLAAAVAGLISNLNVQISPTNKTLNISGVTPEFNTAQLEALVTKRLLAVEKREGYRIVKGITSATNSAWHQITTRRIVDYAIYGVRSACNPYIGKLNNERVRAAMKATVDGFLTRMVETEALIKYNLSVSATRADEIAGRCKVTMTIVPAFSIDFVMVDIFLG
jgi:hypothetical protein